MQVVPPLQPLPHDPQFMLSVSVLTHAEPQSVVLAAEQWHAPAVHVVPEGHTVPHAPQFELSVCVLVQVPPQRMSPGVGQTVAGVQVPAEHVSVAAQACPHEPQFEAFTRVSTSQPLAAVLSQSANPVSHVPTTQLDPPQLAVAFGTAHTAQAVAPQP